MEASFYQSYTVFQGNSGIYKDKRTFLSGTFSQTPDFENFTTAYRSSHVLPADLEKGGRSQRDKLDCRRPTEVINDNNISALRRSTTVVYRIDRQALSTARFCRAGELATVDSC